MSAITGRLNPTTIALALLSADLSDDQHRREVDFDLSGDLTLRRDGTLEVTGVDPQLIIKGVGGSSNHHWIKLGFEFSGEEALRPKIYVIEEGSNSKVIELNFGIVQPDEIRFKTFFLPKHTTLLRFDPCERRCLFRLKSLCEVRPTWTDIADAIDEKFSEEDYLELRAHIRDSTESHFATAWSRRTAGSWDPEVYRDWRSRFVVLGEDDKRRLDAKIEALPRPPKFSVLMPIYNTNTVYLEEAVASVLRQSYTNFELCIVDDASTDSAIRAKLSEFEDRDNRVRLRFREQNGNICHSTNDAVEMACGDWIVFMDHDDILAPHALAFLAIAADNNPLAKFIYSDEDKLDEKGEYFGPFFKPDWNQELLYNCNYINHVSAFRRDALPSARPLRIGFEGSQDHDLLLRTLPQFGRGEIVHLPYILYSWRVTGIKSSYSQTRKRRCKIAAMLALSDHILSAKIDGEVIEDGEEGFRLRRFIQAPKPLVSIIIPTRDRVDLLRQCIDSLLNISTYENFEILIVDNGSEEEVTHEFYRNIESQSRIRKIDYGGVFNYSAINNFAAEQAVGDLICFMNNDIKIIEADWLEEMVSFAILPDVGAVGARLFYEDGTLQHGGVILGINGVAGHSHKRWSPDNAGYFRRIELTQEMSAVTAACMVCSKEKFLAVGGFNATHLTVAFNDVDLCLRLKIKGYRNVYNPYARLYHFESISRGSDMTPDKIDRFKGEMAYMQDQWADLLHRDPAYNPNLTLEYEDFSMS